MKHYVIILLALTPFLFRINALADGPIDHIKNLYQKAVELESDTGCDHCVHQVTLKTMLAAVGLRTTVIRLVNSADQVDPQKDPYWLKHSLHKVTVSYNIAASVDYTIEYLYDEKEEPVFHYWREKNAVRVEEKRFYFHQGKLIKVIMDYHTDAGEPVSYTMIKGFSGKDLAEGKSILSKAASYRKLFRSLVAAEETH